MTNPAHIAYAYITVAEIDYYLVRVDPVYTADELDAAEQILIKQDNAVDNNSELLNRALDLLEHDRKAMR